jgi:hypothetical protein
MRMSMRRFTRLTNAFSKKAENHEYAVSLHFMDYNFCRIHTTLAVTFAMGAGMTEHLWDVVDLVRMIEEGEASRGKAGYLIFQNVRETAGNISDGQSVSRTHRTICRLHPDNL